MSIPADVIPLPSHTPGAPRFAAIRAMRLGDVPMIPLVILVSIALVAVFANQLAPHNPEIGSLTARFKPPFWVKGGSTQYLLGTDQLGRDVLSRLIFGARVSMVVGLTAVVFAAIVGTSMWNIVIILGLTYWTRYARVIRGEVLSLKEREFVRLAIVAGCSKFTIMRRHILPNVINSAAVLASLMLGVVIITEATLSFLGVGVPPPEPAWGLMLSDGKQSLMVGYWWLTVFPGGCIVLMVLSANILGDWLRVKLDPQLRQHSFHLDGLDRGCSSAP